MKREHPYKYKMQSIYVLWCVVLYIQKDWKENLTHSNGCKWLAALLVIVIVFLHFSLPPCFSKGAFITLKIQEDKHC